LVRGLVCLVSRMTARGIFLSLCFHLPFSSFEAVVFECGLWDCERFFVRLEGGRCMGCVRRDLWLCFAS
jgi:hypothetical protein